VSGNRQAGSQDFAFGVGNKQGSGIRPAVSNVRKLIAAAGFNAAKRLAAFARAAI